MVFKLNISHKGKSWKLELEGDVLSGKSLGDKIDGKLLKSGLEGYEMEITGGSDFAGFPMYSEVEGSGLNKRLFTKGWGFSTRSKNGLLPKGVRKRKSVRGRVISEAVVQINLKVLKEGSKKLEEIFPEQNQPKVKEGEEGEEKKEGEGIVNDKVNPEGDNASEKITTEGKNGDVKDGGDGKVGEEEKGEVSNNKTVVGADEGSDSGGVKVDEVKEKEESKVKNKAGEERVEEGKVEEKKSE